MARRANPDPMLARLALGTTRLRLALAGRADRFHEIRAVYSPPALRALSVDNKPARTWPAAGTIRRGMITNR